MSDQKQHEAKGDDVQRSSRDSKEVGADMPTDAGAAARAASAGNRMEAAGAMQRAEELGADTARAGRNVLRGAVSTTEELGTGLVGGAAHIATDLVHGVTDLGYEVRNGATGLIGAVGDIGSAAVNTVTGVLVDVVGGVRQIVNAAVQGNPDGRVFQRDAMQSRQSADHDRTAGAGRPPEEPRR